MMRLWNWPQKTKTWARFEKKRLWCITEMILCAELLREFNDILRRWDSIGENLSKLLCICAQEGRPNEVCDKARLWEEDRREIL